MLLNRLLNALEVRIDNFFICQVSPGWRLAFDAGSAETVHYVLKGEGTVEVSGAQPLLAGPDCFLILPRGVAYCFGQTAGGIRELRSRGLGTAARGETPVIRAGDGDACLTIACGTVSATYSGASGLFAHLKTPIVEHLGDEESLRAEFERIVVEMAAQRPGMRAMTEALLKQCLIVLLRRHLESNDAPSWLISLGDGRLAQAITAMLERPAEAISLEDLAAMAGMSRSAFSNHFAATFGQSPFEFLTDVRLRRAARLLEATDLPIKAVASTVGYASRSYFSRAFTRLFGVDPSTFRRRSATVHRSDA